MHKLVSLYEAKKLLEISDGGYVKRELRNSELYGAVRSLTQDFKPEVNADYTIWSDFYLPVIGKGTICLPFSVVKYNDEYILEFNKNLGGVVVLEGNETIAHSYLDMVKSTHDFTTNMPQRIERFVPYTFRTGTILRKHLLEEGTTLLSQFESEEILKIYNDRKTGTAELVSLNAYLETAVICYTSSYGNHAERTPLEWYRMYADGRHGGMLDIGDHNSISEFNEWMNNKSRTGAHPFEIVYSPQNYGIMLSPPHLKCMSDGDFIITFGDYHLASTYVNMVKALASANAPFSTTVLHLEMALKYLKGETVYTVNSYSQNFIDYFNTPEENGIFGHIEWDQLKLLQRV